PSEPKAAPNAPADAMMPSEIWAAMMGGHEGPIAYSVTDGGTALRVSASPDLDTNDPWDTIALVEELNPDGSWETHSTVDDLETFVQSRDLQGPWYAANDDGSMPLKVGIPAAVAAIKQANPGQKPGLAAGPV